MIAKDELSEHKPPEHFLRRQLCLVCFPEDKCRHDTPWSCHVFLGSLSLKVSTLLKRLESSVRNHEQQSNLCEWGKNHHDLEIKEGLESDTVRSENWSFSEEGRGGRMRLNADGV
jgi:hypothetical protein